MINPGPELDLSVSQATLLTEWHAYFSACSAPRVRLMGEFAEAEIRVVKGPCPGPFRRAHQPYSGLWFALVDSGLWPRRVATGPSQSGKTLCAFVIPILYHLFEVGEDVICLIPQMDMAKDKWLDDLLPSIEASRYKALLPVTGAGSRGGSISSQSSVIRFRNGASLKFMTGGGDDKRRAGKTCRVLVVTEADGMDESGDASREGDKISQTIKRTAAFGDDAIVYIECTTSIATGFVWRNLKEGTDTRIVVQCRMCYGHITPEREDLHGWQEADNVVEARANAMFVCPLCGAVFSDDDRKRANESARVLHRGQTIDAAGNITGDLPPTETLGFRWNAFNNLFVSTGWIGVEEFNASRDPDRDNAERIQLQFVWTQPFVPDIVSTIPLDALAICARYNASPRGSIPPGSLYLAAATDVGQKLNHWVVVAFLEDGSPHIVDYGVITAHAETLGVEIAMMRALLEFHALCERGWELPGNTGARRSPDRVMVDSGYQGKANAKIVYEFIRAVGLGRYWPSKGYGSDTELAGNYNQPKAEAGDVKVIGEDYHITLLAEQSLYLVHINADAWKSFTHQRLTTPVGQPGAMTLFHAEKHGHLEFAKHLTAEEHVREFVDGKGFVEKWKRKQKRNHWFDALAYALMAGHLAGSRILILNPGDYHVVQPDPPAAPPAAIAEKPAAPFVRPVAPPSKEAGTSWIRRG